MDVVAPTSRFTNAALQGVGLGLRHQHFSDFTENKPDVPWLEVHTENFMHLGSTPAKYLEEIRADYPISMHCIGMSLGTDYNDHAAFLQHLRLLKKAISFFEPRLVSDHLSWSGVENQHFLPDLLPLPYTEEALNVIVRNIEIAQDVLGQQILVENPSSYLSYNFDAMPEWTFLTEVAKRSGCGLLFDLNNIHVAAHNHGFDARHYLTQIPPHLVQEIHLAGYDSSIVEGKDVYIDTHGKPVYDAVWELYSDALKHFGDTPSLIEWDTDIPEFSILMAEKHKADALRHHTFNEVA